MREKVTSTLSLHVSISIPLLSLSMTAFHGLPLGSDEKKEVDKFQSHVCLD